VQVRWSRNALTEKKAEDIFRTNLRLGGARERFPHLLSLSLSLSLRHPASKSGVKTNDENDYEFPSHVRLEKSFPEGRTRRVTCANHPRLFAGSRHGISRGKLCHSRSIIITGTQSQIAADNHLVQHSLSGVVRGLLFGVVFLLPRCPLSSPRSSRWSARSARRKREKRKKENSAHIQRQMEENRGTRRPPSSLALASPRAARNGGPAAAGESVHLNTAATA